MLCTPSPRAWALSVPRCLKCSKALGNWQFHRYNVRVIPSHIGQYRIIRKIGAGGMGMVFLGEHMLLGRRAAIKTLLPTVAVHREIVERFFNEARATSAISDPGVIQIFDFGYHVDGTAYIVMELLEGEALSARIDRLGRLGLGDALRIARQIAGSLAAAHARGIVHRDLKPENIFLVCDAEAQGGERTKILDFGICKVGTDVSSTEAGTMIGTPVYMSPEQCRGAGGVDHRADIYAFGCLLFYMVTGRPPFDGDAPGELIVAHLNATPVPASQHVAELPLAVDELLLRCLAKSPADRFQSMTELQLTLGELYVQLDGAERSVGTARPAMLLGRGFRSIYDASAGERNASPWRKTPETGRLRANWFERVPTTGSSAGHAGELESIDDLDPDLDVPPRRNGVRVALACVAVVGVVLGLVATSFVTYSEHGDDERTVVPQAALAVERAPDRSPVAQVAGSAIPAPASAAAVPGNQSVTTTTGPAVAAIAPELPREREIDAAAAPRGSGAEPSTEVNAPAASPGSGAEPARDVPRVPDEAAPPRAVAAEIPRELDDTASPEPRESAIEGAREIADATSAAPRGDAKPARSSRKIEKPSARPRPRPRPVPPTPTPTPTPPSASSEDLYDTR
jgi:serine/threonine protein kinase